MNDFLPLPVSVCIIAGNEAHRLGRTLASVKDWTAETVVVVDSRVTDGTGQLAASHGARVFTHAWEGFAGQRNFTAHQATQTWLLAVDADEVVSDALREEIISLFRQNPVGPTVAAVSFPRLSWFCGRWIRHGDWYPDRKVRLWRKDVGRWEGDLHEKLVVKGPIQALRGNLLHYSNESIDQFLGKISSFSALAAVQHRARGEHPGWLDLAVRPAWKFFRGYVIKRGFLDGWPGYLIAWTNAFSTVARQARMLAAETGPNPEPGLNHAGK